jgi:purine nucleoside phosphorylase
MNMISYQDILLLRQGAFGGIPLNTASIGGSGTFWEDRIGMGFPEVLSCAGPKTVVEVFRDVSTPFGDVPIVKLIDVDGFPVVRVPYHGWRLPEATVENTLATFWLLYQLGIEQVVVDASVGGIRAKPWDFVIPSDVLINDRAKEAVALLARELGKDPWVRMLNPFCPRIRKILLTESRRLKREGTEEPTHPIGEVIDGGVTVITPLSVFETACEVRFYKEVIPDAVCVNQSTGQEAALARVLGMCIAFLNPVANYAEGLEDASWMPEEGGMQKFYQDVAMPAGVITYRTTAGIVKQKRSCECRNISQSCDLSFITHYSPQLVL